MITRRTFRPLHALERYPSEEWTEPSLDVIDHLCLEGIAGAGDELEAFER